MRLAISLPGGSFFMGFGISVFGSVELYYLQCHDDRDDCRPTVVIRH